MSLQCGIVGLPNVGKSTLFNALTKSSAPAENFPFCTIDPHVGIVNLPDKRLDKLKTIYNPEKVVPATVEFIDIAGLVEGANKGEGLGNKFLGQIRETSAIIHVVRCFDDSDIVHVNGNVNPIRDAEIIETELLLADLDTLERKLNKTKKLARGGDKRLKIELGLLERLIDHCGDGLWAKSIKFTEEEFEITKGFHLLTNKPILYVANISENDITSNSTNKNLKELINYASSKNSGVIKVCASIEQEISTLSDEEEKVFLIEYNLKESGLNKIVRASFNLLGLQTYFTGGPTEVRAWTINKGYTAKQSAGVIHSDFERGFIKAEVFSYDDLVEHGSENALSNLGLARTEGKDYIVKDGDCIFFKFNV
ncbi:MAG: redox-regulated ATPase YchF [Candidatus Neomarinimicrobiota bacterium]